MGIATLLDPMKLTLTWTAGDPVQFSFIVKDVDWSGTYRLQVRNTFLPAGEIVRELAVESIAIGADTRLDFYGPEIPGEKPGRYVWDLQEYGGVTRLGGTARIRGEVTE
jgi:hypothetical protein